jgi:hypothetical protein
MGSDLAIHLDENGHLGELRPPHLSGMTRSRPDDLPPNSARCVVVIYPVGAVFGDRIDAGCDRCAGWGQRR